MTDKAAVLEPKRRINVWRVLAGLVIAGMLVYGSMRAWHEAALLAEAQVDRVYAELRKTTGIDWHVQHTSFSVTPLGLLCIHMRSNSLQHPAFSATIKELRLYFSLWSWLFHGKPHLVRIETRQPQLSIRRTIYSWHWPKIQQHNMDWWQGSELLAPDGLKLRVDLPNGHLVQALLTHLNWQRLNAADSRLIWQGRLLADTLSEGRSSGELRLNGWQWQALWMSATPQQLPWRRPAWLASGWPTLRLNATPGQWQIRLQAPAMASNQAGSTTTPYPWQLQDCQAQGRWPSHSSTLKHWRIDRLTAQLRYQQQPINLSADGTLVSNAANQLTWLQGHTRIQTPTRLNGFWADGSRWSLLGQLESAWSGPLVALGGQHQLTLSDSYLNLARHHGQALAHGQLYMRTVGARIQPAANSRTLAGQPNGFSGNIQLYRLQLGALTRLLPAAWRFSNGLVDGQITRLIWLPSSNASLGTAEGHLQLSQVRLAAYPDVLLHNAEIQLQANTLRLNRAKASLAGQPVSLQGQLVGNQLKATLSGHHLALAALWQTLQSRRAWLAHTVLLPPLTQVNGRLDINLMAQGPWTHPICQGDAKLYQASAGVQGQPYRVSGLNGLLTLQPTGAWHMWVQHPSLHTRRYAPPLITVTQAHLRGDRTGLLLATAQTGPLSFNQLAPWIPADYPLPHGHLLFDLAYGKRQWRVTSHTRHLQIVTQGHTAELNGDLVATARSKTQLLTGITHSQQMLWLSSQQLQLTVDRNIHTALHIAGDPFHTGWLHTSTPLEPVWRLHALSGLLSDTPPYQSLSADWEWHYRRSLRLLKLVGHRRHAEGISPNEEEAINLPVTLAWQPKRPDDWLQWSLRLTEPQSLAAWQPYLNPLYFAGLTGTLSGQASFELGRISQAYGRLQVDNLVIPPLQVGRTDAQVDFTGPEAQLTMQHLNLPGLQDINLVARMEHWNDWPIQLTEGQLNGRAFNLDRFQPYVNDVLVNQVANGMMLPLIGPWQPGMLVLPFELHNADTHFNEAVYSNILLQDVSGLLSVNSSSYTEFNQAQLSAANGTVTGTLRLSPLNNNFLTVLLEASNVQANALAKALLKTSNQIFGTLTGQVRFTTQGQTTADAMQHANGEVHVRVVRGRVPALNRMETLLTGVNIIRGGLLGVSLNNLAALVIWPFNKHHFSQMGGDLLLSDGKAHTRNLSVRDRNLLLVSEGNIRLEDAYSDMIIHGQMAQNVKGVFGKPGQWSLTDLVGRVPGITLKNGHNVLTYVPALGFVPGFGPPAASNRVRFHVKVKGILGEPRSIQSVAWDEPPLSALKKKRRRHIRHLPEDACFIQLGQVGGTSP